MAPKTTFQHVPAQLDFSQQYSNTFDDSRPTILFDLNGVLIQPRTFHEEKQAQRQGKLREGQFLCYPRPGLRHLASLCRYFRIGLYTSARILSVVPRAADVWEHTSMDATVKTFMEFHSVPKRDGDLAVPGALFALVLDRSFCRPDPGWQRRPGGRPHDSIKPLAAHGFDPARTIIIDDSLRKILPDEHGSAIILPEYVTAADPACASEPHDTPLPVREPDGTEDPLTIPCQMPVLRVLACLLLHHVRGVDGDIRPALEHVRADLEQALSTGNLPDCLAHIQDTPPQPGVGELPLVFLSPPEQPRYGMPRLMDQ